MKRLMLALGMAVLLVVGCAEKTSRLNKIYEHECVIKFVNNTNKYYVFWLKWIDHPFLSQTRGKPWIITCTEISPGESFIDRSKHAPGSYTTICQEQWKHNVEPITRNFIIMSETREIVITTVIVLPMNIPIVTLDFTPKRRIKFRSKNDNKEERNER